jgi:hypothetical protein
MRPQPDVRPNLLHHETEERCLADQSRVELLSLAGATPSAEIITLIDLAAALVAGIARQQKEVAFHNQRDPLLTRLDYRFGFEIDYLKHAQRLAVMANELRVLDQRLQDEAVPPVVHPRLGRTVMSAHEQVCRALAVVWLPHGENDDD